MRLDFSSAVSENLFGFRFLLLLSLISLSQSQEARWWRLTSKKQVENEMIDKLVRSLILLLLVVRFACYILPYCAVVGDSSVLGSDSGRVFR